MGYGSNVDVQKKEQDARESRNESILYTAAVLVAEQRCSREEALSKAKKLDELLESVPGDETGVAEVEADAFAKTLAPTKLVNQAQIKKIIEELRTDL